jgi:hypothetical protein
MNELLNFSENAAASLIRSGQDVENLQLHGRFHLKCFDKEGNLKWEEEFDNTVVTVGKNLILDTVLAGSGYSVTGPYMGLISSVGWSGVNVSDTMSSHSGWTEAGATNAPTYSGNRKTCTWNPASGGSKSLSSACSYTFTGSGTVKGCFIVLGTGASNTIDNTGGTLLSAGTFTNGDRSVLSSDVLNVSYTLSA